MLPNNTILGKLIINEVYEYYDGPRLFSCQSASGRMFIAVWLGLKELDGGDEENSWLYVGLSDKRFEQIRLGAVDLCDAFRYAEDGMVFHVVVGPGDDQVQCVLCDSLSPKWLPIEGERLNLKPTKAQEDVEQIARLEKRERLRLRLAGRSEAPARYVAHLFGTLQLFLDSLGRSIATQVNEAFSAPDAELLLVKTFPSSVGIDLAMKKPDGMFGMFATTTPATRILDRFVSFLETESDGKALRKNFAELKVFSDYEKFLSALSENKSDLSVEWGSPKGRGRVVSLSHQTIEKTLQAVQQLNNEYDIPGILIAAKSGKRSSYLFNGDDGTHYSGHILDDAFESGEALTIRRKYTAVLRSVSLPGQETKKTWDLVRLKPYHPEQPTTSPMGPGDLDTEI